MTNPAQHEPGDPAQKAAGDQHGLPEERADDRECRRNAERQKDVGEARFSNREAAQADRKEAGDLGEGPREEPDREADLDPELAAEPGVQEDERSLNDDR